LPQTLSNRSFAVLDCVIAGDRPVPDGRLLSRLADDLADGNSPAVGRAPATGRDLLELLAKVGNGRPGLIDEYRLTLNPVILAEGTPLFMDVQQQRKLRLTGTRQFASGAILLRYEPDPGS
jgi:hypothetical protein